MATRLYFKGWNNFVNRRGYPSKTRPKKNEQQRNVAKRCNKRTTARKPDDFRARWKLLSHEFQIFHWSLSVYPLTNEISYKISTISSHFHFSLFHSFSRLLVLLFLCFFFFFLRIGLNSKRETDSLMNEQAIEETISMIDRSPCVGRDASVKMERQDFRSGSMADPPLR